MCRSNASLLGVLLLGTMLVPGFARAMDCTAAPSSLRGDALAPLASELAARANSPLGSPNGVLSQAYDESQSVDQVLLRIHVQSCQSVATTTPAPSVVGPDDPAAYKPKTQFDNTPWRFNMSQNGKNMTADEFSAWMKSRGVRVARGAGPSAPAASQPVSTDPASAAPATPPQMPPLTAPANSPTPR